MNSILFERINSSESLTKPEYTINIKKPLDTESGSIVLNTIYYTGSSTPISKKIENTSEAFISELPEKDQASIIPKIIKEDVPVAIDSEIFEDEAEFEGSVNDNGCDFEVTSPKRLCSSLDSSPADNSNKISINDPSISKSTHSSPQSKRRSRTVMTPSQTRILLAVLEETYFPSNEQREQLSKILQIPQRTIQVWFQNQRQKAKQFGRSTESSSPACSPSTSLLRHSPGIGLHHGIPISPYSQLLPNHQHISNTNYPLASRRPILLYGSAPPVLTNGVPPSSISENLFHPADYSLRFPMNQDVPIRKRTLPIPSSSGSWGEHLSWRTNNNNSNIPLDYYKSSSLGWGPTGEKYKGHRSGSLPIQSIYSTANVKYYNQTRSNYFPSHKIGPNSSPGIVLSSLLQSTSLVKKEDSPKSISTSDTHKAPASIIHEPTKDLEKFKDEEDQLELPSLLLALRG